MVGLSEVGSGGWSLRGWAALPWGEGGLPRVMGPQRVDPGWCALGGGGGGEGRGMDPRGWAPVGWGRTQALCVSLGA